MFLPVTRADMAQRGWSEVDFVMVTGDAYVDHHSFGMAILSRLLERYGYRVAVLARPDYHSCEAFRQFGRPRLGFLINSGAVDSMVNHYTVFRRKRRTDAYAPGGVAGGRPDRAVIVYSNRAREAYRDVPILIGGIEASLRRLGHYDYWSDRVRRSILLDARADLLLYGMGERALLEVAEALAAGLPVREITWVRGTCYRGGAAADEAAADPETCVLPAFDEIVADKAAYCKSFVTSYRNQDAISGRRLVEPYTDTVSVVVNPPQPPLEQQDLDDVYALPFENAAHPMYAAAGEIPAFREVKFSLVSCRGCFGGCSFCALTYHQGRQVRSRSKAAIVAEAEALTRKEEFKGYIHDVGGPTANFRHPACKKQLRDGVCTHRDCLFPTPCPRLEADHTDYLDVLRAVRAVPGVKKVFIRSGLRYDYIMADPKGGAFLRELCRYHVSGTLKVAPEHFVDRVLEYMHKPRHQVFLDFARAYAQTNRELGLRQYLIPYLISSHPGSTLEDAAEMAVALHQYGFVPDQVQDFYPTPATLATCMYYTGLDPFTLEPVYVARDMDEKKMQRALLHYHKAENRATVIRALRKIDREDLIPVLLGGERHESDQRVQPHPKRRKAAVSKRKAK